MRSKRSNYSQEEIDRAWYHEVMTTGHVAAICRVSTHTVGKWIDEGILPGWRYTVSPSEHSNRYVHRDDVVSFLKTRGMDRFLPPPITAMYGVPSEARQYLLSAGTHEYLSLLDVPPGGQWIAFFLGIAHGRDRAIELYQWLKKLGSPPYVIVGDDGVLPEGIEPDDTYTIHEIIQGRWVNAR